MSQAKNSWTASLFLDDQNQVQIRIGHFEDTTWASEIRLTEFWVSLKYLVVCSIQQNNSSFRLPQPHTFYNMSLLKSALQKAIRRSKVKTALQIAWQLFCQAPDQLLRRLAVIVLEDVCLHPEYPFLIWSMIAFSKGWLFTHQQVLKLFSIVQDLASCKFRELTPQKSGLDPQCNPLLSNQPSSSIKSYFTIESTDKEVGSDSLELTTDRLELDIRSKTLVGCIILRINYGGMKGDREFLHKFAVLWHKRFLMDSTFWFKTMQSWYPHLDTQVITEIVATPPVLTKEDKIREGVDFHCFPNLLQECNGLFPDVSISEISAAVWYHCSALNNKKILCSRDSPFVISYPECDPDDVSSKQETKQIWETIQHGWEALANTSFWRPIRPPEHKTQTNLPHQTHTIDVFLSKDKVDLASQSDFVKTEPQRSILQKEIPITKRKRTENTQSQNQGVSITGFLVSVEQQQLFETQMGSQAKKRKPGSISDLFQTQLQNETHPEAPTQKIETSPHSQGFLSLRGTTTKTKPKTKRTTKKKAKEPLLSPSLSISNYLERPERQSLQSLQSHIIKTEVKTEPGMVPVKTEIDV